jgi:DNA-binding LacI/PurR family transcriptional regulator
MFANDLQPRPCDMLPTVLSGINSPDTHLLELRLREADRPNGFVVMQDLYVAATIDAIESVGLNVPADVRLVALGSDIGDSGVPSVTYDTDAMVRQSVDLLVHRIRKPARPPQTRIAGFQLVTW